VVQGVLVLFGADFGGRDVGWLAVLGLAHLAAVALASWGLVAALKRFGRATITVQILAIAVTFSVVAFWLGPNSARDGNSREFAAVLPLAAALAGRLLARRLRHSRLVPALAAVIGVYVAGLVTYITRPAAPAQNQVLADWLAAHHLSYGLADYWLANSVTVDSGGKVAVRAFRAGPGSAWAEVWEAKPGWYSAAQHVASFVVVPSYGPGPGVDAPSVATVVHAFGQPARVYLLPQYTVMVWTSNLLARLGPGAGPPPTSGPAPPAGGPAPPASTASRAATQRSRPVAVG